MDLHRDPSNDQGPVSMKIGFQCLSQNVISLQILVRWKRKNFVFHKTQLNQLPLRETVPSLTSDMGKKKVLVLEHHFSCQKGLHTPYVWVKLLFFWRIDNSTCFKTVSLLREGIKKSIKKWTSSPLWGRRGGGYKYWGGPLFC